MGTKSRDNLCYAYDRPLGRWYKAGLMPRARVLGAGVMIDQTVWWITGGNGTDTTNLYRCISSSSYYKANKKKAL